MASKKDIATVELQCIPDNPYAIAGVINTKRVRFDIETKRNEGAEKRTPINLALVLDRSGSMEADSKLKFAKKALISVLNLLHDNDIVHLVAYDGDVSIVFENLQASSREHLHQLIDSIEANGSTNISGAIDTAGELLSRHVHDGFSRRIFLFSDGQANVGLRTPAELSALVAKYYSQGIITDSFGIGADFNGEIMKGIADAGGSRFYFLSAPELIEVVVSKAIVCVFGVCSSRVRLLVRGRNGAIVTKIWGHDNILAGASLGDLHSDNLRSVLCEFTTSGTANTEVETLVYELRYNRPDDLDGQPTVITNTLSLKFVEDELLVTNIDPRVKIMYATQEAADMDKKIAQLVKNGDRNQAIELVNNQIALLKEVEKLDDDKGIVSLLLRLADHMQKKLNDVKIDRKILFQGFEHQAHLKEECDYEDMGFGMFD